MAACLAEKQIKTIEDLLYFLPLDYEDRRQVVNVEEAAPGIRATIRGIVTSVRNRRGRRQRVLEITLAKSLEDEKRLQAVWFRPHPGLRDFFHRGQEILLFGTVNIYQEGLQIIHAQIIGDVASGAQGDIKPRYPEVPGVSPGRLASFIERALEQYLDDICSHVPKPIEAAHNLLPLIEALKIVHLLGYQPADEELAKLSSRAHPAHQRLVFEELFRRQFSIVWQRQQEITQQALTCPLTVEEKREFDAALPFELTSAQRRVLEEIWQQMGSEHPMQRLLQGDVGSGKTAVAFGAAFAALRRGRQVLIMAPTEILAQQHFQVMHKWATAVGLGQQLHLLTATTPTPVKESLLALAIGGRPQLIIGTHALLAKRLELPNLALVIVDEQHRFGVRQRWRLRERQGLSQRPHLLAMSATPIPRSLALMLYGDLDLSLLDEKPPGRLPTVTRVYFGDAQQEQAWRIIEEQIAKNEQVIVVCPAVDESEKCERQAANVLVKKLGKRFSPQAVAVLHARLPRIAKEKTLSNFREGKLPLLVATTVIEVGLDIPAVRNIVVMQAQMFGLAQLHQLRGRVGRGGGAGFCLLLTETEPESAAGQRLSLLAKTDDGFAVAEADLRQRGPGEIWGTRQAGMPRFRLADIREHYALLAKAHQTARQIIEQDPSLRQPEHLGLLALVDKPLSAVCFGGEAG